MKRNIEIKYLFVVLILICSGFLLNYAGMIDRSLPSELMTLQGPLDISDYFLTPFPNAYYGLFFGATFLLVHLYLRIKIPEADPFILPAMALLSGIGAIMILRLSPDLALSRNDAILSYLNQHPGAKVTDNVLILAQLGTRHFRFVLIGLLVMIVTMNLFTGRTFSRLSSKKYLWVVLSAMLIYVTLKFGTEINGRRLWLFGFQTVEIVKLFMLLFISGYIYEKGRGVSLHHHSGFRPWFNYTGPFVAMWCFALIPIFVQRDLGPTFIIFALFLLMLHYAGSPGAVTGLFVLLTIVAGYVSYASGYPSIVHQRFEMLFDPFGKSENMARVLWSVASGGIRGAGIGYGQPDRIPVVQSDFNFAAICEEMGFVGGIVLILGYMTLLIRCLRIARQTDNDYQATLSAGIGTLLGLQTFVIIFGNLGVVPITGMTLPLVSYGGSSLLVTFFMMGILLRISGESRIFPHSRREGEVKVK